MTTNLQKSEESQQKGTGGPRTGNAVTDPLQREKPDVIRTSAVLPQTVAHFWLAGQHRACFRNALYCPDEASSQRGNSMSIY